MVSAVLGAGTSQTSVKETAHPIPQEMGSLPRRTEPSWACTCLGSRQRPLLSRGL